MRERLVTACDGRDGNKDGNGDPIPDTRRVFDPLGDEDGIISLPVGI